MQTLKPSELALAAEHLLQAELVAFPTETVYGLGAPIFNDKAISKIFTAKNRPADNPLIAHIANISDVERIAINIPQEFYQLASVFWPGSLSILLEAHSDVPLIARAGLPTIAVRMPAHPLALSLITLVGQPLVAPSANLSGKPSATSVEHVLEDFTGKIAAVVDGGDCQGGLESTVLSLQNRQQPVVLRPGAITCKQIAEVLGCPVRLSTEGVALSPGMKYRHYAPKAPIQLVFDEISLIRHLEESSKRRVVLRQHDGSLSSQRFYAALRRADRESTEEILILCDEKTRNDEALWNRILKASGHS
ncbi:MAG: threonylcarbamoyl-AMP synthase [Simkania sp.]|nr:threonylcarbamoyl-AMP synthase [Simkania sp.]